MSSCFLVITVSRQQHKHTASTENVSYKFNYILFTFMKWEKIYPLFKNIFKPAVTKQ